MKLRWHEFIPPFSWDIWQGIFFAAFIAFFAFIGFEDMVNVAEEVIEPRKISCSRFLAQATDSTALPKNIHLTYG
jgi:amino acid transporter